MSRLTDQDTTMTTQINELFVRGLHALRRTTIVWSAALLLLALSVVSVWPSMEASGSLDSLTSGLSPDMAGALGLEQFNTAAGYLRGNLYAVLLPLALSFLAITATTALTAGDEDAGRMELLLALPVTRTSVYAARLAAVVIALIGISILLSLAVTASVAGLDMDVTMAGIAAVSVAVLLLGVLHACIAYGAAGAGLSRSATNGVASGVLVVGYLLHAVVPLSPALEPLAVLSPWEWALGADPLLNGLEPWGVLSLLAVSVMAVALGTIRVERRDIRTA